jgi:Type II CAAX prenyl endopeptidase Rce1-like
VDGIGLGIGVDIIANATISTTDVIHFWNLILVDALLGPVIEESLFRGCLLPIVAPHDRTDLAAISTAAVFATFHLSTTLTQWLCFVTMGTALGWDPNQIGLHHSFGSDARDIQCDFVFVASFVDRWGNLFPRRLPQETSFTVTHCLDPLEPVIDSL